MILFLLLFLYYVAQPSTKVEAFVLVPVACYLLSYIVGQVIFIKKITELDSGATIKSMCRGEEGWVWFNVKFR